MFVLRSFTMGRALKLVVLSLGFCLLSPAGYAQKKAAAAAIGEASLTVNTSKAETSQFKRYLTINGNVFAWQDVVIAPEVGGYRVEAVLVDVGDVVTAGQPLVKLSTSLLQTDLNAKQAVVKQRESALELAKLALTRGESVAKQNLLATSDLDKLKSDYQSAVAILDGARADLDAAKLRLQYAVIKAPDDGVITSRTVTVGQLAQVGSEMLRMLRHDRVEWRGEVPETRLPSLKVGQTVIITDVDSKDHEGKIRTVSPTVNPNTHNGLIYVDIASDTALRVGMFASGRIEFAQTEALLIPLSSMVSNDGYNYVFVVEPDHKVRRQMIKTGILQGNRIEVLEGLKTGSSIVVNGAGFLKDGDLVNVVEAR